MREWTANVNTRGREMTHPGSQHNAGASDVPDPEVTRVAREVGTEGRLGGQAKVEGVSGTWKDLTDGVNSMTSNLTSQMRNIAEVTTAVANGEGGRTSATIEHRRTDQNPKSRN